VTDVSAAQWVAGRLGSFGSVGGLVPRGFASYARILHPADSAQGQQVRWAQIAAWSDRRLHARVQFEALIRPGTGAGRGPAPWTAEPATGELCPALLSALCERLVVHTHTPQRCWFCLWDGWGWIDGSRSVLTAYDEPTPDAPVSSAVNAPAFPRDIIDGPRVRLPGREYILLEGPLHAAEDLGDRVSPDTFFPQSPNLFWPQDRAWCVATEIDLDSTYLGGSPALIHDLLHDPRLEALAVHPEDPIWADSDTINQ
jgi:hypothetical protein